MQLPGVDPNDPSVKDLLATLQTENEVIYLSSNVLALGTGLMVVKWKNGSI
jgi:hypothetical protein